MDTTKALAELEVLRGFIDFVNRQIGVYCDCLSSFQGNKVRIERQVARVSPRVTTYREWSDNNNVGKLGRPYPS